MEAFISWRAIDGYLRDPPAVLATIFVAVLVAEVLRKIVVYVGGLTERGGDVLIVILELLITFVLVVLTLKAYFFDSLKPNAHLAGWHERPLMLLVLLVLFGFLSMIIYMNFKRMK